MKTIGITGSNGFVGWHLRAHLLPLSDVRVIQSERTIFNDPRALEHFVATCDAVVHLAGLNRGEDGEVYQTNIALTQKLTEALRAAGAKPHVIFSSSTHKNRDTAYGKSKRESGDMLLRWGAECGAPVSVLVFPNIFGEFTNPNYNSAVATFCSNLVSGKTSEINKEAPITLIHAQNAVARIYGAIQNAITGETTVDGMVTTIGAVYEKLKELHAAYVNDIVPDTDDPFSRDLFNTLRSYLPASFYPRKCTPRTDERGTLFEVVKHGSGGQTFFSTTNPDFVRGNHYHRRKFERFLVTEGEAEIQRRKVMSPDIVTYRVSGSELAFVDMPTFFTHNIKNIGSGKLTTLFWTNEIFNPEHPDTYIDPVETLET